nr:hypothetical protein [Tanacetum cinerariifolium]
RVGDPEGQRRAHRDVLLAQTCGDRRRAAAAHHARQGEQAAAHGRTQPGAAEHFQQPVPRDQHLQQRAQNDGQHSGLPDRQKIHLRIGQCCGPWRGRVVIDDRAADGVGAGGNEGFQVIRRPLDVVQADGGHQQKRQGFPPERPATAVGCERKGSHDRHQSSKSRGRDDTPTSAIIGLEVIGRAGEQRAPQRIGVTRVVAGLEVVSLVGERRVAVEQVAYAGIEVQNLLESVAHRQVPQRVRRYGAVAGAVVIVITAGEAVGQRCAAVAQCPAADQHVRVAGHDVGDGTVGVANDAVAIEIGLVEHGGLRERLNLVGDMNPPEVQAHRQVVQRLINEAQSDVARFLRRQVGIAATAVEELLITVTARLAAGLHSAACAKGRVIVVTLAVGQALRRIQLVQRRRAEAFAVRAAHDQLFERLEAERVFRVGGAAEVAVLVVAHGCSQFQAVQNRHVQLGVFSLDAAVAGNAACRVQAQAVDVVDEVLVVLVQLFLAVFAAQRQPGLTRAEPVADLAADASVHAVYPANGGGVLAVAAGQSGGQCTVADVAGGHGGNHFALVVIGAQVVIPAANGAVEGQQQALVGVLILAATRACGGFAPGRVHRLGRVQGKVAWPRVAGISRAGGLVEAAAGYVVLGKGAVVGVEILLFVVVEHAHDVEAVFVQVAKAPAGTRVLAGAATAGGRGVAAEAQGAVGQRLFGDEVDDTANGVRAIQRRCAVAQHFDAVDGGERNHVQVDGTAIGRADAGQGVVGQTAAVEQDQRLVGTDAAHVGVGRAAGRGADRACAVHHRLTAGDALDHLFGGGHALLFQLFGAQNGHRHCGFRVSPTHRGAGDFHAFELGGGRHRGHRGGGRYGSVIARRGIGSAIRAVSTIGRAHADRQGANQRAGVALYSDDKGLEGETRKAHQHGNFRLIPDVGEMALAAQLRPRFNCGSFGSHHGNPRDARALDRRHGLGDLAVIDGGVGLQLHAHLRVLGLDFLEAHFKGFRRNLGFGQVKFAVLIDADHHRVFLVGGRNRIGFRQVDLDRVGHQRRARLPHSLAVCAGDGLAVDAEGAALGKGIEVVGEIVHVGHGQLETSQEEVVNQHGGHCDGDAHTGGDQCVANGAGHRLQAGGAAGADALQRFHDPPDRAEQADERRRAANAGENRLTGLQRTALLLDLLAQVALQPVGAVDGVGQLLGVARRLVHRHGFKTAVGDARQTTRVLRRMLGGSEQIRRAPESLAELPVLLLQT